MKICLQKYNYFSKKKSTQKKIPSCCLTTFPVLPPKKPRLFFVVFSPAKIIRTCAVCGRKRRKKILYGLKQPMGTIYTPSLCRIPAVFPTAVTTIKNAGALILEVSIFAAKVFSVSMPFSIC